MLHDPKTGDYLMITCNALDTSYLGWNVFVKPNEQPWEYVGKTEYYREYKDGGLIMYGPRCFVSVHSPLNGNDAFWRRRKNDDEVPGSGQFMVQTNDFSMAESATELLDAFY
jgi:hypothetical protein